VSLLPEAFNEYILRGHQRVCVYCVWVRDMIGKTLRKLLEIYTIDRLANMPYSLSLSLTSDYTDLDSK